MGAAPRPQSSARVLVSGDTQRPSITSVNPSATLPPQTLDALRAAGTRRRFRPGQVLFHEGDPSDHVALITAGQVKISAAQEAGGETVLAVRGPDDLVGELSAIDHQPRSATATAVTAVEAVVVTAKAFRTVLTERPGAALSLLATVVARLRAADRQRVEFGSQATLSRLARRLVELAEVHGHRQPDGAVLIELPVTQDELAGWVGASRESVARALRALRAAGVVATARRAITVLDENRLRHLAR